MITKEDFIFLSSDEARELLLKHQGGNPTKMALVGVPRLICSAIATLEKCKKKLPDHYDVMAIVDDLAYEQSSSKATALSKGYSGTSCLDLTMGLGVDSYYLSKSFERVTSLERFDVYAQIGKYNLSLLGAENIDVINTTAQEYLDSCSQRFDMVYVDPARREDGGRSSHLVDCSPNVIELKDKIFAITNRLVIKASPMFDQDEAIRLMQDWGALTVTAVSLDGECKELLIEIDRTKEHTPVSVCKVTRSSGEYQTFTSNTAAKPIPTLENIESAKFLYLPDVAFYKMRRLDMATTADCYKTSSEGVLLSHEPIDVCGLGFEILSCGEYSPKKLKSQIKKLKSGFTIYRKGSKVTGEKIRSVLSIKDGSANHIVFTNYKNRDIYFWVRPL